MPKLCDRSDRAKHLFGLTALALVVGAFFVMRWIGSARISLSIAQYICVGPVVFLLWCAARESIPRAVILFGLLATVIGGVFAFSYRDSIDRVILVATLSDDDLEATSRVLRESIRTDIGSDYSQSVGRYYDRVENLGQAQKLLSKDRRITAMIWGSKRWVNLSLPPAPSFKLSALGIQHSFRNLDQLEVITWVPSLGVSLQPMGETVHYLSSVVRGLAQLKLGDQTVAGIGLDEGSLKQAGQIVASWRSVGHRAYPWFWLGNFHLSKVFENHSYQPQEMRCALQAYQDAREFLRNARDLDLGAAISSNLGVALLVRSVYEDSPALDFVARQHLIAAAKSTNGNREPYYPDSIARRNLSRLRHVR